MLPHGLAVPERSADRSLGPCTVGRVGVTGVAGVESIRVIGVVSASTSGVVLTIVAGVGSPNALTCARG
jgi:hypothetical protein